LHLQALVLVEGREQETELVLEIVEVGDRAVRQVGRLEDETLGHVTAAPQMIEDDQIADEESVGCAFEHRSDANGNCHAAVCNRAEFLRDAFTFSKSA
jgi:hypothetical protein